MKYLTHFSPPLDVLFCVKNLLKNDIHVKKSFNFSIQFLSLFSSFDARFLCQESL